MIALIDYDAGNMRSVEKALTYLGERPVITRKREEILKADRIILPGVGSFGDAMENLERFRLSEVLKEAAKRQIPLLGICLGMQLTCVEFARNGSKRTWDFRWTDRPYPEERGTEDSAHGMEFSFLCAGRDTV